MHDLCDRCDNKKPDGKCEVCTEEEQKYFRDRDLCNFASVRGHAVVMRSRDYCFARKWYMKSQEIKI
jgi:hypothetical protein